MTNQPTGDRLVADARRAVHEALVVLPAAEADRVRSLIADLETAVEARTAMRASAVPVSSPSSDQTAEPVCKFEEGCHRVVPCDPGCGTPPPDQTLRDRIAKTLARTKLRPPYLHCLATADAVIAELRPPADRAALIAATARACAAHLRDRYSDTWTEDAARSLELNAARIERGEQTALLRRLAAEAQQPDTETRRCCGKPAGAICVHDVIPISAEAQQPEPPPVHKGGNPDDCP